MNALRVWLIHRLGGVEPSTISAREATQVALLQNTARISREQVGTTPSGEPVYVYRSS